MGSRWDVKSKNLFQNLGKCFLNTTVGNGCYFGVILYHKVSDKKLRLVKQTTQTNQYTNYTFHLDPEVHVGTSLP